MMNNHYFIENESLKSQTRIINYEFGGKSFKFKTHDGVFSKEHVDHATDILLNTIPPLEENSTLLDMGCGYGSIGIVLAKSYNLTLTQCDINPATVELTRYNSKLNGVTSNIFVSDCFENVSERFDTIVINPPIHAGKAVTYEMYEKSLKHLTLNGKLYVVTFKKHGAESTITKLRNVFNNCETIYKKKGIYVLECIMMQ
ncbi:MAG: methyltransferase [Oscillospiraceae bacterium]|nr:methyltransferase [Oscillospiraceae bacterium]